MNPFSLDGPGFLLFYLLFGVLACVGLRAAIKRAELRGDQPQAPMASDPYLIAYLRGGPREAVKVATIALIDRGLLTYAGDTLKTVNGDAPQFVQRDIEREILRRYLVAGNADAIVRDAPLLASCGRYRKHLQERGMLHGPHTFALRLGPVLIALAALLACSVNRVAIALANGHRNVWLLVLLTAVFVGYALWQLSRERCWRGIAQLRDLSLLFARLKQRAHTMAAGGSTNDMALAAAVFGLGVLPGDLFPYVNKLYRPTGGDGGGGSDSGGSSDGGGDGGGSSCGGGGGCGGCGS